MNVGELFFSLGFKSTGVEAANQYEGTIDILNTTMGTLNQTMDAMLKVVEEMAIKMGAMTQVQVDQNRQNHATVTELKKGVDAEEKNVKAKTKSLGIIGALNQKMPIWGQNITKAKVQILLLTGAITGFVKKASDAAVGLDKMQSLTGVSTDNMQRLGYMAAQTGASVDDIAGAIKTFQQNSVNIKLGRGGDLAPWTLLGLSPHTDPIKVLEVLSKKLKTMPTAYGTTIAKDMGLSEDLIYMLKNAENLEQAPDEILLTKDEIKRLKDFNFYFNRIWAQTKNVLIKLGAFVEPLARLVVYGADRIGKMITGIMTKIEPFMGKLEKWFPAIAVMVGVLFAAFFPLTALLIGLGVVLEDLWTWSQGGDSVFGRMIKDLQDVNGLIEKAINLNYALLNLMTGGLMADTWAERAQAMTQRLTQPIDTKENKENAIGGIFAARAVISQGRAPNTNNVTFNIDGAYDPKLVADTVQKRLDSVLGGTYFTQAFEGH
jgi:hypothetical protein